MPVDVESLPFDQYQRYRLVSDLVGDVRGGRGRLRVLDVGGRTALLRRFLPEDRVDLVDMEAADSAGLVLGDGSRLPFRDASFDVVAAFDTLEHVPPPYRAAFVAECARVSRGHVFLAGPYQAPRVDEAEEFLLDFLRQKLGFEHRYLAEHRHNGLPDRGATEAGLAQAGLHVASVGHGNLDRWLLLMCVELYVEHDATLRRLAERLYRFYNASLYTSDHLEPVYRHVVVGARAGLPLPDARRVLGSPGAPPEALPAILPLAAELLSFDHHREALAPELARLHTVIRSLDEDLIQHRAARATLEADLAGHRSMVQDLQRERDAQGAACAALAADLEGHRKALAEARADAERLRAQEAELRAEIEARGAAIGHRDGLLAEAEARREALRHEREELRELLQHHRTELEAHGHALREREARVDALQTELMAHGQALADREARVDDLHAELTAALERARAAEDEVDGLRADAARLVRLLRSRLGNLGRAFAPRKFGDPR